MTRLLHALARVASALYPRRATIHRDEVCAFLDEAIADAWRERRWRGLSSIARVVTSDLARAWAGRAALPLTVRSARPSTAHGRTLMDRWLGDLRYSWRALTHARGFAAVAVLTLALGIGATTAVYAVVDGAILRPFPYPDMARLAIVGEIGANGQAMSVSWPNFVDWQAQNQVFDELGLYRGQQVTLSGDGPPDRFNAALVSSAVFASAGIPARSGRVFGPADDLPGSARVALVSERLWRSRFGGRSDIVGLNVILNNEPFQIAGVMPPEMRFPSRLTDVWLPLGRFVDTFPKDRGAHPGLQVIGRMKDGVTIERARAGMNAIATRLAATYPNSNKSNGITVTPYYELVVRDIRPALYMLLGAVGLLLVMGCSNLASLMLARAEARQRELAVRAAIGATRTALLRQLLVEAGLLAGAGAIAGVALATIAVRAFVASRPSTVPRIDLIGIDWRVVLFATAVSALTVALFALLPAWRASAPDLQHTLRDLRGTAGRHGVRMRRLLVAGQIGVAAVLLVGAGLLAQSLAQIMQVDLGFNPSRVVTMRVTLPDAGYPSPGAWIAFHENLLARLAGVPGAEAIGLNTAVPLEGGGSEAPIIKEGDPTPSAENRPAMCLFQATGGQYFDALGIALVLGRVFDDRDRESGAPVAVIDETAAAKLFGTDDPIGRRVAFEFSGSHETQMQPLWREVVGVVRHVRHYGLVTEPPYVQVYAPFRQLPFWYRERRPGMALFARTTGDADAMVASVRRAVTEIDPRLPVFGVQTMSDFVGQRTEQPRLSAMLVGGFAIVALLLAATGVYGVLSYLVSRRTSEIGLRLALGARRTDILRQVVGQGLTVAAIGLAMGLIGAAIAARAIASVLIGVSPRDVSTFAAVAALLLVVAIAASFFPARRASGVDPLEALRTN
jgi:putative ABC transport system permease protein